MEGLIRYIELNPPNQIFKRNNSKIKDLFEAILKYMVPKFT